VLEGNGIRAFNGQKQDDASGVDAGFDGQKGGDECELDIAAGAKLRHIMKDRWPGWQPF
jgi:hypothetical protein